MKAAVAVVGTVRIVGDNVKSAGLDNPNRNLFDASPGLDSNPDDCDD